MYEGSRPDAARGCVAPDNNGDLRNEEARVIVDYFNERASQARPVDKRFRSVALARRARFAAVVSRLFIVFFSLSLMLSFLSMLQPNSPPSFFGDTSCSDRSCLRAREAAAYYNLGEELVGVFFSAFSLGCWWLSARFAKRWARSASESLASLEIDNRRELQTARCAALPFVLFLRGFEEEQKSIASIIVVPWSADRVDKATRWVEAEIVDEFRRRQRKVFCIANPSEPILLPGAMRLAATSEDWLSEIATLATECEVVVVYLSAKSNGLLAELDLLRHSNLTSKSIVIVGRKLFRRNPSLAKNFPTLVTAPSPSISNQSAFGPIVGVSRFRRELKLGIDKIIGTP